jgi:hypothetical protein
MTSVVARTSVKPAPSWSAQSIEAACRRSGKWYRSLPAFDQRAVTGGGSVVGRKHPAILSERDCVVRFARFLEKEGVPWDAMHHEVPISRWLFDGAHPAGAAMTPTERRRRLDLVLVKNGALTKAKLPALVPGFQFDAILEFHYLPDDWTQPRARVNGDPVKGRAKVEADVEQVGRHLAGGACRAGYVIVFEECDWGFPESFAADAEAATGCKVRFVRGYATA